MELKVTSRTDTGKGSARKFRKDGLIPAIVYGSKNTPMSILVNEYDLTLFIKNHGTSRLLTIDSDGSKKVVLFKAIDRDTLSGKFLHIDFQEVDQTKEVVRTVALHFVGIPVGVSTSGGITMTLNREIEISCLPSNIPDKAIDVNIEALELNDSLHASSINLPSTLKLVSPEDMPLLTITLPKAEVTTTPAEGEEGEEGAEGAEATAAPAAEADGEKKEPEIVGKKGKKEEE